MIPVGGDEILSRQCYKFLINFVLRIQVKSFISARLDLFFVLPGSHFVGTKFSHVIASARLNGIKMLININLKISIEVLFNRSKIFLLCFYEAFDITLREK